MSIKEARRLSVMEQLDKKAMTIDQASRELRVGQRQVLRIKHRFKTEGAVGIISRRRGKPNVRQIPQEVRQKALKALADPVCKGWGPTFAKEKLSLMHKIEVSAETIRKWMIEEGLWKSKKKKERKIYQRRTRRSRFGELVQGDGSHHAWFEDRGEKCALLVFVDDATSRITSGKFFPAETTEGYLDVLELHLKKYGIPRSLYVDKHSVFRVNRQEIKKGEGETHFGKVLKELGVGLICAHSPQAKGRVERANGTLQDRLVKELRLRDISSIEEGNAYLPEFIKQYNRQFGKKANEEEDAHLPLRSTDNLKKIFARKEKRKLSKDLSFQYKGIFYQLEIKERNRIRKTHVDILEMQGKPILVEVGGKSCGYKQWKEVSYQQPKIIDAKELELSWRSPKKSKPKKHHPWR